MIFFVLKNSVIGLCLTILDFVESQSSRTSLEDLRQVSIGLLGTVHNILASLSGSIYELSSALQTDLVDADEPILDNDLENPLLNPSNFHYKDQLFKRYCSLTFNFYFSKT